MHMESVIQKQNKTKLYLKRMTNSERQILRDKFVCSVVSVYQISILLLMLLLYLMVVK